MPFSIFSLVASVSGQVLVPVPESEDRRPHQRGMDQGQEDTRRSLEGAQEPESQVPSSRLVSSSWWISSSSPPLLKMSKLPVLRNFYHDFSRIQYAAASFYFSILNTSAFEHKHNEFDYTFG